MTTPTKDEFLGNLQALNCGICFQPFDTEHVPIQLRCFHVVGADCIANMAESTIRTNNQCPLCRRLVFQQEDFDEQGRPLHEGAADSDDDETNLDTDEETLDDIERISIEINQLRAARQVAYEAYEEELRAMARVDPPEGRRPGRQLQSYIPPGQPASSSDSPGSDLSFVDDEILEASDESEGEDTEKGYVDEDSFRDE